MHGGLSQGWALLWGLLLPHPTAFCFPGCESEAAGGGVRPLRGWDSQEAPGALLLEGTAGRPLSLTQAIGLWEPWGDRVPPARPGPHPGFEGRALHVTVGLTGRWWLWELWPSPWGSAGWLAEKGLGSPGK